MSETKTPVMTPEERAKFCASLFLNTAKVSSEKRARVEREIAATIREAVKAERHANIMAAENLREGSPRSNRARGYNDACDDIAAAIRKRPL